MEYKSDFTCDLVTGKKGEKVIGNILEGDKVEVKSERGMWMKTGNIAIEYESYKKPSGIQATESDYWFHNLCVGDNEFCTLVFKTDVLKTIVNKLDYFKTVSGGDNNASKMYLINLQKLFSSDVIKAFEETEHEKK